MKKKNFKSLKLNKRSISNLDDIKAGIANAGNAADAAGPTGYSPCRFTPTYLCDYFTNPDGMCKPNTYVSECDWC